MSIPSMAYSLSWLLASVAASTELARAQCPEFSPSFGPPGGGVARAAEAQVVFDDGTGPALYVVGGFAAAGDVLASNVARWDGTRWSTLGSGLTGQLPWAYCATVFDDGTGPSLVVGGTFTEAGGVPVLNIAAWNGATWSPLGAGLNGSFVEALAVFDDGSGPALYAGGLIADSGATTIHHLGKWDGSSWSDVGGGPPVGEVHALWVHDDGSGSKLYVGGDLGICRWDGTSWSTVGGLVGALVHSLTTFDDGTGPALYVGGDFTTAGGLTVNSVAKWDGQSWSSLSGGVGFYSGPPDVRSLGVYDDGSGPRLYVGGLFTSAGGAPAYCLASWDGATWSPIDGVYSWWGVLSFGVFDPGTGPELYVGASVGSPTLAPVMGIARWNGAHWSRMQSGNFQGVDGTIQALATYDDGGGRAVYAGGLLSAAGDVFTGYSAGGLVYQGGVAKWDGANWSTVGSGVHGAVYALAEFDDGSGPALYAGGYIFSAGGIPSGNVVRWNGQSWSPVGPAGSLPGEVDALCVYDDGHGAKLYAGGLIPGGFEVWDPANGWTIPPGGYVNGRVESMAVHDRGAGSRLVVGGKFNSPEQDIAEWDGNNFAGFGCGIGTPNYNDHVWALATFDFGSGAQLVAGGNFHRADCAPSTNVVAWNGSNWVSMPEVGGNVRSFARFDDGSGPALYAGVAFPGAMVRLSGSSWSPLGNSTAGYVYALMTLEDTASGRNELVVGSDILTPSEHFVGFSTWRGCAPPGAKFCFGDGSGGSCPCANDGALRRGCENSHWTGGAELTASGGIQPDTVVLRATGELTHALSVFLQGSADVGPFLYGDGLRCAGGSLLRLFIKNANGGFVAAPQAGDLSITARSAQLGDPIAPGSTRYYQTYYRDPNPNFCPNPPGNTWNTTNGVVITW